MHPLGTLSASSVGHFFAPLRIMLQKQCLRFGMGMMSFAFPFVLHRSSMQAHFSFICSCLGFALGLVVMGLVFHSILN